MFYLLFLSRVKPWLNKATAKHEYSDQNEMAPKSAPTCLQRSKKVTVFLYKQPCKLQRTTSGINNVEILHLLWSQM